MPALITSLSLLLATSAALTRAVPYEKRGLAQVISQCHHGFAYTFDDGPYESNTALVDKFASRNGHTTFFMNGNNYQCIFSDQNVQRLRHAYESGMQIASHTWSHADLATLSHAQIDAEIQRLDEAFVKILGVRPKFIRPPYGSINEDAANYIQQTYGKTIVLWDLDSGDSVGGNEQSSVDFYYHLAFDEPNTIPHLTLSHETLAWSVAAVLNDGTVDALANQGHPLLTVAECLDMPAYDVVGGYGTRDSSWCCDCSWTPGSGGNNPPPSSTSSAPPTGPTCKQTYTSVAGDNCQSIDTKFNLVSGTIFQANSFLNCNDIWVGTPICVPDGPYNSGGGNNPPPTGQPDCAQQTYTSSAGETCDTIEGKFALPAGQVKQRNSFVTCTDIWSGTSLNICVPTLSASDPQTCTQTYTSVAGDNCANIATKFSTTAQWIKAWNGFLNCIDVWVGTSVCVRH